MNSVYLKDGAMCWMEANLSSFRKTRTNGLYNHISLGKLGKQEGKFSCSQI